MKWFKHDADANQDAKLRKLRHKYGAQGYGIYWYCLELIARNVEKHNLTFELEHDAELVADDFKLSSELVQEMMTYMVKLELFEMNQGVITCLKMATRTDEYMQRLIKTQGLLPTLSVDCPDNEQTNSDLIEEKRREEKRREKTREPDGFDFFWNDYPNKKNKHSAFKAWKKLTVKERLLAHDKLTAFIRSLPAFQSGDNFNLYPASYLNQKRWNDVDEQSQSQVSEYMRGMK